MGTFSLLRFLIVFFLLQGNPMVNELILHLLLRRLVVWSCFYSCMVNLEYSQLSYKISHTSMNEIVCVMKLWPLKISLQAPLNITLPLYMFPWLFLTVCTTESWRPTLLFFSCELCDRCWPPAGQVDLTDACWRLCRHPVSLRDPLEARHPAPHPSHCLFNTPPTNSIAESSMP